MLWKYKVNKCIFIPKVETIKRVISPDKLERNTYTDNKDYSQ